jgi:hypothetical protein
VTPKDIVLDAVKPFVVLRTLEQRNQSAGSPGKDTLVKRTVPLLDHSFAHRLREHLTTFTRICDQTGSMTHPQNGGV